MQYMSGDETRSHRARHGRSLCSTCLGTRLDLIEQDMEEACAVYVIIVVNFGMRGLWQGKVVVG